MSNENDAFSITKKLTREEKARAIFTYNMLKNGILTNKGLDIDELDYNEAMCLVVEELSRVAEHLANYDILKRRGEV